MMRIIFRADASLDIGSGHVMRCLTLARQLSILNAEVHFICRPLPGNMIDYIKKQGFPVITLPKVAGLKQNKARPNVLCAHSHWLGCSWQQDVSHCRSLIKHIKEIDWLVVDHYALDINWHRAMSVVVKRIMVIDDLADRDYYCHLLLDQNLPIKNQYKILAPKNCKLVLGPKYALLREEFADYYVRQKVKRKDSLFAVMIFVGGVDAANDTQKILDAVAEDEILSQLSRVIVVVGSSYPFTASLNEFISVFSQIELHRAVTNMAELLNSVDFVLGASGSHSWERACLGVPALVVSTAANQRPIAAACDIAGFCKYLGDADKVSIDDWQTAIQQLISNPKQLQRMSSLAVNTVAINGAEKIADLLTSRMNYGV